ncbi:CB1 cannabinoid receptor-interacting protein 1 [Mactra antiquata]
MATEFKLTFRMKEHEGGGHVCYKQDGQRFDQCHTVKLNAATEYDLSFTLKPAIYIDKLMINGELHKLEIKGGGSNEGAEEAESKTYTAQYSTTGFDVSKSGKRQELLFVLELQNGVYMKISFQCKLYKTGEKNHSLWGQKLTAVEMECRTETGHNYVTVLKEKYL